MMPEEKEYDFTVPAVVEMVPAGLQRALDVGCSGGALGHYLKTVMGVGHVSGIELSSPAAAKARGYLDNVFEGDVCALNLPEEYDGFFDIIIYSEVLEQLYDPWGVIRKHKRYLRPGGYMLAAIPNLKNLFIIMNLLFDRFDYTEVGLLGNNHIRFFTATTATEMFTKEGLELVQHRRSIRDAKWHADKCSNTPFNPALLDLYDHIYNKHIHGEDCVSEIQHYFGMFQFDNDAVADLLTSQFHLLFQCKLSEEKKDGHGEFIREGSFLQGADQASKSLEYTHAPRFLNKNPRLSRLNFSVGDFTYGVTPKVFSWGEGAGLSIGKYSSFADDVQIFLGGEHRPDWVTTYPFNTIFDQYSFIEGHPKTKGDVVIGNDVWIGYGATIMSGVVIGDGAVIGAKAVVTHNVKPYEVVAGNPARHIRFRFSERIINALLEIKWWDWPIEQISTVVPLLQSGSIDDFLKAALPRDSSWGGARLSTSLSGSVFNPLALPAVQGNGEMFMHMEDALDMSLREVLKIIQNSTVNNTTYLGVPALKCPMDAWVYEEIIFESKPDVIIEIGVNFGGGALRLAHFCDILGKGRVIGVDTSLANVPASVRAHPRITLIEKDAVGAFGQISSMINPTDRILVIEDSAHTYDNTLNVLRAYSVLVKTGDYFIVEDSICWHGLDLGPRPGPYEAVEKFLTETDAFVIDRAREKFFITWNPKGYLKRVR